MAAWSALYPLVLLDAPGCPEPLMDSQLRQAAIRFLKDSGVHVLTASVPFVASTSSYSITPPADVQVHSIIEAQVTGQVTPMSVGIPSVSYPAQSATVPSALISGDDTTGFTVWPTPTTSGTMVIRYTAIPTQTATTLPDNILARFADEIATGAKSRILRVQNRPFTNVAAAMDYEQQFRAGINRAKIARQRGVLTSGQQVQMRRFGV